jgi:hypothetical protein
MYVMTAIFEANVFPVSRISEHWWRRTPAAAWRKWRSRALAQTGVRQGSWFWRVREETEAEEGRRRAIWPTTEHKSNYAWPHPTSSVKFQRGSASCFSRQMGEKFHLQTWTREQLESFWTLSSVYGLQSAPRGVFADSIAWVNNTGAPILSLDNSPRYGFHTGDRPGRCIQPGWPMTLALPKTGLARGQVRQPVLADIGIPAKVYGRLGLTHVPPFGDRFRVPLSLRGAWDVRP